MDQIFSLKCISEKHIEKRKKMYYAFIDLENANDKVNWWAMWKGLQM